MAFTKEVAIEKLTQLLSEYSKLPDRPLVEIKEDTDFPHHREIVTKQFTRQFFAKITTIIQQSECEWWIASKNNVLTMRIIFFH